MSENPWSVPVAVAEIPDTGRHVDLSADEGARAAIAKLAGLPALPRLEAAFDLSKHSHNGVRVVGRVTATVEQNCVLTLEPLENEVEEDIDLVFVPPRATAIDTKPSDDDIIDDEMLDVLQDGFVDLGAIATEFLLLGIDPYPRKPGSVFTAPRAKESPASHPFAALAALKKDKSSGNGS
jgi:uncharacterized metal-binding protein YceD (DUF177 family)